MEYNYYFDDHGIETGDKNKSDLFLYNNNFITFVIIVVAIITSEFWFEFFHQILREVSGQSDPSWYYMLLTAIIWTLIFLIITYYIFKVPVAASFTY